MVPSYLGRDFDHLSVALLLSDMKGLHSLYNHTDITNHLRALGIVEIDVRPRSSRLRDSVERAPITPKEHFDRH